MCITLADYFNAQPRGAMKRLAGELGVSPAMISQWAAGERPIHPKYIPRIERWTGMQVRRWAMCPDWAEIWEELASLPDAPKYEVCITDTSTDQPPTEGASA